MVYGYARVSTKDQHLGPQLAQLQVNGCDEIFREKVSGAKDDRPELQRMLRAVEAGDTVVVCKLDRIARSTRNLLNIIEILDKRGVSFKVLNINLDTATPTGKLMLTMLGAIATFEREMMLERQKDGIDRAKSAGKYKGRDPKVRRQSEDILALLAAGKTRQQVAEELGVGVRSIYRVQAAARE